MKEILDASSSTETEPSNTETQPLTFVRVAVRNADDDSILSQVRMRDVADRGVVLGD